MKSAYRSEADQSLIDRATHRLWTLFGWNEDRSYRTLRSRAMQTRTTMLDLAGQVVGARRGEWRDVAKLLGVERFVRAER